MSGSYALVFERDGLGGERVRRMLQSESFATCLVDQIELFHALRARAHFDLFIVGVADPERLADLALDGPIDPLVLLAPLAGAIAQARCRMAFPDAVLVDRELRDPDALRRVLPRSRPPSDAQRADGFDPVGAAFSTFELSRRQLEVLALALKGETSREIAQGLFISEPTVRNHLHAIYERVGVSGRRELLGRFVRGLMEANA